MGRRTYLYSLAPSDFERVARAYARGARAHLARPVATAILDLGRRPDDLVGPFAEVTVADVAGRQDGVRRALAAVWDGPVVAEHPAHADAARAVRGSHPLAGGPSLGRPGRTPGPRYHRPPEVASVSRGLARGGARFAAAREAFEGLAVRLGEDERRRAADTARFRGAVRSKTAEAAGELGRIGVADLALTFLTGRPPAGLDRSVATLSALVSDLAAAPRAPYVPVAERGEVAGAVRMVRRARAAWDAWEEQGVVRRIDAVGSFYERAAGAGTYVVVERS